MSLLFSPDHPITTLSKDVLHLSQEFLDNQGFNYFACLRFYKDGSFVALTSLPDFLRDWLQRSPVLSSFPQEYEYTQRYTFLWDEGLPSHAVNFSEQEYQLYSGITLIYRYKDYYDMVGFSRPQKIAYAGSYYLSSLPLLDYFYQDFLKKGRDLIKIHENAKVILPMEKQDRNFHSLILTNQSKRYPMQGKDGSSYVTKQELFCMQLLESGKAYKEIGGILDVSPRTVETYLVRAKQRTGFDNLSDILRTVRQTCMKDLIIGQ